MSFLFTNSITESFKSGVDFYTGGLDSGSIDIRCSSRCFARAIKISSAGTTIAISSNVFAGKVTHNASTSISSSSSVLVRQPILFSANGVDTGLIRTLVYIDGKPISNHNRSMTKSLVTSMIENENWNAETNRYYKRTSDSGREEIVVEWRFLPNQREKTADGGYGRDFLAQIAEDPDTHTIQFVNQDESGATPYTTESYDVFIKSYDEKLVRRDLSDGVYYFDCQLGLEQVS